MKRLNQAGSHVVGLVLLVLALAVVGFSGYKVQQARHKTVASSAGAITHSAPATISNTADLQHTAQALDDASTQLNSNLDDSSLNADLGSML